MADILFILVYVFTGLEDVELRQKSHPTTLGNMEYGNN